MAAPKSGPKMKIIIDQEQLENLASMHCTMSEMAAFFNCSVDTLERNYAEVIKSGKEKGKASLRRLQWKSAQQGNVSMLIWMGKQLLGQRDFKEIITDDKGFKVMITDYTSKPEKND